jgi:protoporphyrinogen oxidase
MSQDKRGRILKDRRLTGHGLLKDYGSMSNASDVVVIGGGFTGIAAAYDLARAGKSVTLVERDSELGGLGGTFEILPGIRIEKFYHHWFNSDRAILGLIEELGLGSHVRALTSRTGLFYANTQFRLSSPWDLLNFTPLPVVDRIRTGILALRARRVNDWHALEEQSAADWLIALGGRKAYEVVWQPLLHGKFGVEAENVSAVWIWNKLKLRGGSRGKKSKEELLYFDGGFQRVISAIEERLRSLDVRIHMSTAAESIDTQDGKVRSVTLAGGERLEASRVLATLPIPLYLPLVPSLADHYRETAARIRFLGNVCLVLRLERSLSDTYWLNVADPSFPFVGIIEHTNFDSPANFNGEHIAYLSKYLPTSEPLYSMGDKEVFDYAFPFIQRMFPHFQRDWVRGYSVWRAPFSQPVVTKRYSALIPSLKTPIEGLFLCSMAQVYPEDRGTNYAVQYGRQAAKRMLQE